MSRYVEHTLLEGRIRTSTYAQTIPEALAIEAAIKAVPPAVAFQPVVIPEYQPLNAFDMTDLPPAALADADDSGPVMMDQAEAVARGAMEHGP